jgi:hypothetical protein
MVFDLGCLMKLSLCLQEEYGVDRAVYHNYKFLGNYILLFCLLIVRDIHHSLDYGPNFLVFHPLKLDYHLFLLFQQQKYDMRVETSYCFFDVKGTS